MDKYADPKKDWVFKKLFGRQENKDLLIGFINDILQDRQVEDVEYLETNMLSDIAVKKESIIDVLCTDKDGSRYIIEMQTTSQKGFEKRAVFYASKTYISQMNRGDKYENLKDVIFIGILNFVMFPNKKEYISRHNIRDILTNENDISAFSFMFLELPKFQAVKYSRRLEVWCDFFKHADEKRSVEAEDPLIQRAYHELEIASWNEKEFIEYEKAEKIRMDNEAVLDFQLEQAEKLGIEKGIAQGIEKGKMQEKLEIAHNLVASGFDLESISVVTQLSIEEIQKLTLNKK